MDLDILFWIAIAAIYVLQALLSKKKSRGTSAPERAPSEYEGDPDLGSALEEIRNVLRGAPVEAEQASEPPPHWERVEPKKPTWSSETSWSSETPRSSETSWLSERSPEPPRILQPLKLPPIGEIRTPREEKWPIDITDMRKAVVMSEILRPPVSKRKYRP